MTTATKVDLEQVAQITKPVIEGAGYALVDLEWKREQGGWILRLFIDKPDGPHAPGEGITLDACAEVATDLSTVLDVSEAVPGSDTYSLEVGSPGLDYPLKRAVDFGRVIGDKVKVKTRRPLGPPPGRRHYVGPLVEVRGEGDAATISVDVGDRVLDVPVAEIEKANLVFNFDDANQKSAQKKTSKQHKDGETPTSLARKTQNGSR
ncbi:MAG: ribosome maturation factor RimP [Polyangia bacterium]